MSSIEIKQDVPANPYYKTLTDVISASSPPSYELLSTLLGYLANQEDKVYAIRAGLIQMVFQHYQDANDAGYDTDDVRTVLSHILNSLILLSAGRAVLFQEIGTVRFLRLLEDDSVAVRQSICSSLRDIARFPDCKRQLLEGRVIIDALEGVFLNDILEVARKTLPALGILNQWNQEMGFDVMLKMVKLLNQNALNIADRHAMRLSKDILTCLWHTCCASPAKELAIQVELVAALAPLIKSPVVHIQRMAVGTLKAIAVAESGKRTIIESKTCIEDLSSLVLELETHPNVRTNAVLCLKCVAENPAGLHAAGVFLLQESEVLIEILTERPSARVIARLIKDRGHRGKALEALYRLTKTNSGKEAGWEILEIVPFLHSLIHSRASSIKESIRSLASHCLEAICANNVGAQQELEKVEGKLGSSERLASNKIKRQVDTEQSFLKPAETAILLLQFQNDYTQRAGAFHRDVREMMDETSMIWNTVDLVEHARDQGVHIVHVPMELEAGYKSMPSHPYGSIKTVMEKEGLIQGSWGADFTDQMEPGFDDIIIKGKRGPCAFSTTNLDTILRKLGVENIAVAGFSANIDVESTCRSGMERGYSVFALTDCIAGTSHEAHQLALDNFHMFSKPVEHNTWLSFLTTE